MPECIDRNRQHIQPSSNLRTELRLYFSKDIYPEVEKRIFENPNYLQIKFITPITESVYFSKKDYTLISGKYFRLRRYVKHYSRDLVIDNSYYNFEIKSTDNSSNQNTKSRVRLKGKDIVKELASFDRDKAIIKLIGTETVDPLYPWVGKQTLRFHFQAESNIHVALEQDIQFFGFSDLNYLQGRLIGRLDEAHLEIKGENRVRVINFMETFEATVMKNCTFSLRSPDFAEKKVRACHADWLASLNLLK